MRTFFIFLLFCSTVVLPSCSWDFYAYIINRTSKTATINVFLLDISPLKTLPNKVKVSEGVVPLKAGYRKNFDKYQNVEWLDVAHFRFIVKPNSMADLADMVGMFRNGFPRGDVRVIVATDKKVDTLINGRQGFNREKFMYKHVGLTSHILHYDIKE